jgi:hypothetical protein
MGSFWLALSMAGQGLFLFFSALFRTFPLGGPFYRVFLNSPQSTVHSPADEGGLGGADTGGDPGQAEAFGAGFDELVFSVVRTHCAN